MDAFSQLTGDELFATALYDLSREDLSNALIKLKTLISRDEHPMESYSAVARVYARLQLFTEAKAYFERFLELHPEAIVEKFQLGLVNLDMGERDNAMGIWDSILASAPNFPPVLYHKALVLAREGQEPVALELLSQLLANAAADNFYFTKGKELADAIRSNTSVENIEGTQNTRLVDEVYSENKETKH